MPSNPEFHISVWSSEELASSLSTKERKKNVDDVVSKLYLYVLSIPKYKSSIESSERIKRTGDPTPCGMRSWLFNKHLKSYKITLRHLTFLSQHGQETMA